jgi:hypothetical protein
VHEFQGTRQTLDERVGQLSLATLDVVDRFDRAADPIS